MITLQKATEISQEKIATLQVDFGARAKTWFEEAVKAGITPYIYEGFRTNERQNQLYDIGRIAPGTIVTHAKGGQSFHNYGRAFDWVPLRRAEKAEGMYEANWDEEDDYAKGQMIASQLGMRAISWETPHLEDASFENWHELQQSCPQP